MNDLIIYRQRDGLIEGHRVLVQHRHIDDVQKMRSGDPILRLTYFHLQWGGLVVHGHRFPFSSIGVGLGGGGCCWVLLQKKRMISFHRFDIVIFYQMCSTFFPHLYLTR